MQVKVDDQALVSMYLRGDESAFEKLLRNNQSKIYGYIYKYVKDADLANDLFQDTFVKVIRLLKEGRYNEEGKFLPWVLRIAHNLVIDYFRANSRMPIAGRGNGCEDDKYDIFNHIPLLDKNIENQMIDEQILDSVKDLMEALPSDQKEMVYLRLYVGMSFKDIAEQYDISINTALGRMRYAIINLRKMVKDKQIVLS